MPSERLERLDSLVKELSVQDDPDRLIRVFNRQAELVLPRDGYVAVSNRELGPPYYRITRSSHWHEPINPWTETHRLPLLDRGLLGQLLYAGKSRIINSLTVDADNPAREHLEGMRSLMCAPGYDRGLPHNMVMILSRQPDAFSTGDLETLLLNANLLGRAVNNLLLTSELRDANRLLDREKEQVGRMQQHMLPASLPTINGLELGVTYFACSRAGGDYYDVLPLPEDHWGLFVADVSGHGTPAAVVMAMIHTLLHSFPGPPWPPLRVFNHLNHHLLEMAPEGMFATAFYGVYDPYYRRLRYASAGHPPPRFRAGHSAAWEIDVPTGLPLGIAEEETWAESELSLTPGDALLFYTDGIIEGTNAAGEAFGKKRLDEVFRLGPQRAQPLVEHLERHYKHFCDGAPDMDDRTLLAAVAVP